MGMEKKYDVAIVGAGPGGLTAAIYAGRAGFSTVLLDRGVPGGQLVNTDEFENYPGFKSINGAELAERMFEHAMAFGATYQYANVEKIVDHGEYKEIIAADKSFHARAVIVATGSRPNKLGVPGEKEFAGRGVSLCAVCDGAFFRDKVVAVVGGGNAAVEEAIFLAKLAKKVIVMHRRDELRAVKVLQDRAFANKKIEFLFSTVIKEVVGEENVTGLMVEDIKTGKERLIAADGLFVYIGSQPITEMVADLGITNEYGHIITDETMATAVPGIYAAGDVRDKMLRQVVTAAGDGSIAAISAQQYLEGLK